MNNLNGIIIFPEWTKCIAHPIDLNIFIIVDKRICRQYYIYIYIFVSKKQYFKNHKINQKPYDFEAL